MSKKARPQANRHPAAVPVRRSASTAAVIDTFVNLMTRQGVGMPNPQNGTQYPLTRLTQNYLLLISLYRNSWIVRKIVDRVAEDMTKAWINLTSDISPEAQDQIDRLERRAHIRAKLTEGVKWARLFGGAAALMMIDGIDEDALFDPLDPARIMPGSFKGLMVLDRWSGIYPDIELVDNISDPEFGLPKYYEISDYTRNKSFMVHHSHILRFPGCHLPSWEEQSTTMWGASEIESVYDELVKRDNASANIAGLIYRANLNIRKIKDLGPTLSLGDQQQIADLYSTMEAENQLANNFSTMAIDSEDDWITLQNTTFTGLNDIYESFMLDVSGATGIPVTLLFGRSPAGLSATGESDLQNYYDMVGQKQETYLRPVLEKLLPVEFMSAFGQVPDDLNFQFNSPRSESPTEQADVVQKKATVINDLFTSGLLSQGIALKELQEIGRTTDMFTNIKDEDIQAAEATPEIGDVPGLMEPMPQDAIPGITDAEPFDESKHPRQSDGKFGTNSAENSENNIDKAVEKEYSTILLNCKTSDGVVIKSTSIHALERAVQRHIPASDVKSVLQQDKKPKPGQDASTRLYEGNGLRVVLNFKTGNIVSVMRRRSNGKAKQ